MIKNIKRGKKRFPPILSIKIGISLAPSNNTIKTKNEKMGNCNVSSPKMMIANNNGTPIKLINTLEDFLSNIVQ